MTDLTDLSELPTEALTAELHRRNTPVPPTPPCGRRDPACPRPADCDQCLPRDRRQLHDRVLTRCDPAWYGMRENPINLFAAMHAVVEMCVARQAEGVDGGLTDADPIWPSNILDAAARELGIRETR